IPESALLSGALEPTNKAYAIAKIAGVELCQAYAREYGANFISALPTNVYGPGDDFDLQTSHVLAALLRKAHEAKMNQSPELVSSIRRARTGCLMKRLRVGVVGVGHIGSKHARIYAELPQAQLLAIVDTDAVRAREIGNELGVEPVVDLDRFADTVDAASIAT